MVKRSVIWSFSSWANTDRIPIMARPKGVEVSKFLLTEIKSTPFARKRSSMRVRVSFLASGETIQLVDDHGVNGVGFDVLQQLPEGGAV